MTVGTLDGSATPYVIASGSVITEQAGDALLLLGSIVNAGSIDLAATGTAGSGAPSASSFAALIVDSPTVTLSGGGTIALTQQGFDVAYGGSAGNTLVNAGNTIEGAGNVGIAQPVTFADGGGTAYPFGFINAAGGVLDGIGSGYTLTAGGTYIPANELAVSAARLENAGLLEATGPGGLELLSGTIDNAGGTILALGTGNPVYVQGDVDGGLIEAQAGGIVYLNGSFVATGATSDVGIPPVLAGVTLQTGTGGTILAATDEDTTLDGRAVPVTITAGSTVTNDGGTLVLTGTIDDQGTVLLGGGILGLAGSVALLGTLLAAGSTEVVSGTTYTAANDVTLLTPSVTLGGGGTLALDGGFVLPGTGVAAALVVLDATIIGGGGLGETPDAIATGSAIGLDNEAGGVIDGDGLQIYGGSNVDINAGLIQTSGSAGIAIQTATFDNTGGTLLADGGTIDFTDTELFGGTLRSEAGGSFVFTGTNTVGATSGAGALTFNGSTVQVTGLVPFGGTLDLLGPTLFLSGGDTFDLGLGYTYPSVLDAAAGASIVNDDDSIIGGQIGDGGTAWSLTNGMTGTISDSTIALPGGLLNTGLLEADGNGSLTIDGTPIGGSENGTILATSATPFGNGTVYIDNSSVLTGVLATSAGGLIVLENDVTLGSQGQSLVIAAGATVQAYSLAYSPPFYLEIGASTTLTGVIELLGTIANPDDEYEGGVTTNQGLLIGSGTVTNLLVNNGSVAAQGGTLTLGTITGDGTLGIDPGAVLSVGPSAQDTVFDGTPGEALILTTPSAYTGALANLVVGNTIDLVGEDIAAATTIDGGSTLAVTLDGGTTLDYGLVNLERGASFVVTSPTAAETYGFTYAGSGGVSGSGSFSISVTGGTADLADLTAFSFTLITPDYNPEGFPLSLLQSFSATLGAGDTLTSLSFTADGGTSRASVTGDVFEVQNLGSLGASTSGNTPSAGGVTLAAPVQQFSDLVVECFAAGTRIATPGGKVVVERLAVGDAVLTRFGGVQRVSWIGHRTLDCRRHPRPEAVWPVRIAADAFGRGLPTRALWLSPDHALFVDGVLIPVKYLVDGRRITQRAVDCITYYHVELPTHDVLLAEGLDAESYLECGTRMRLAGWGTPAALRPEFAERVREAAGCAPLVVTGPRLAAVRARLASAVRRDGTARPPRRPGCAATRRSGFGQRPDLPPAT